MTCSVGNTIAHGARENGLARSGAEEHTNPKHGGHVHEIAVVDKQQ